VGLVVVTRSVQLLRTNHLANRGIIGRNLRTLYLSNYCDMVDMLILYVDLRDHLRFLGNFQDVSPTFIFFTNYHGGPCDK